VIILCAFNYFEDNNKQHILNLKNKLILFCFSGQVSKTEFFDHLLSSGEYGSVDEYVCFADRLPQAYDATVNDFQELYGQIFRVKFVEPKERPRRDSAKSNPEPKLPNSKDNVSNKKGAPRSRTVSASNEKTNKATAPRSRTTSSGNDQPNDSTTPRSRTISASNEQPNSFAAEPIFASNVKSGEKKFTAGASFFNEDFNTVNGAPVYNPNHIAPIEAVKSEIVTNGAIKKEVLKPQEPETKVCQFFSN